MFLARIYLTLFTIPLTFIWTVTLAPIFMLLCIYDRSKAFEWMAPIWGKVFCALALVGVKAQGKSNIDKSQSYVVIANHSSQFDIPIVCGWLTMDLKWVVKNEYKKHPVLGPLCIVMGNAFVDRSDTDKAIASLEKIKQQLYGGTSLLFFPEGTRSKIGKMLPFKKGAFIMAKDLGLPILPVSIGDADKLLPSGKIFPRGGIAQFQVHPAIPASEVNDLPLEELIAKARGIIQRSVEPHLIEGEV